MNVAHTDKTREIIYVVDDDDIYVFTALRVLESIGLTEHVQVFDNGKKALDQLLLNYEKGDVLPDLILLDLNMPIWDGWFFLTEIEKTVFVKKIDIMIVSSSINTEDITRISENKLVKGFISKPLSIDVMKELFGNLQ